MKKFFVSSVVITSFLAYSFYERSLTGNSGQLISPANNPELTPTATPILTPALKATLTQMPTLTPFLTPTPKPISRYKDGVYVGSVADAFYGNIQVQVTIGSGRITDVQFLQYPNDRSTSREINAQADPILAQEAITAQSAQVDIVSGATDSSQAFIQSLQSALDKAKS